jgi:Ca2+-binding EF-hand superfamily protein
MRPIALLAPALAALFLLTQPVLSVRPASAQMTDADRAKRWFLEHDRDRDGYLTIDEVMGYEAKLFRRMDSAGTGRLREDQYCAGVPTTNTAELDRCHTRFAKIDADGDAYITLQEIQAYEQGFLQAADQNQDGKVSLDEFLAATQGP